MAEKTCMYAACGTYWARAELPQLYSERLQEGRMRRFDSIFCIKMSGASVTATKVEAEAEGCCRGLYTVEDVEL